MKIKGIDHIAINTVDINESEKFYKDVLGLEVDRRVPNGDNVLVYLRVNETSSIELFDHKKPIEYTVHPDSASGTAHIALAVSGIAEWNAHLKKNNVEFTVPLCDLEHLGKRVLLFKDPSGVVIELCEDL